MLPRNPATIRCFLFLAALLLAVPAFSQPPETDVSENFAARLIFDPATASGSYTVTDPSELQGVVDHLGGSLLGDTLKMRFNDVDIYLNPYPFAAPDPDPELLCGNEDWRIYRHSECRQIQAYSEGACEWDAGRGLYRKSIDEPQNKCVHRDPVVGERTQYCVERNQVRWVYYYYEEPDCSGFLVDVEPVFHKMEFLCTMP